MNSKVSFTIRPPTASSRSLTHDTSSAHTFERRRNSFIPHDIDSSDEDEEEGAVEAVTGFDQSGVQRLREKPKPSGPLVIPALANRDWRAIARLRKQQTFIPDGVATTGKDGSQGGLGTRDCINSGPQVAGLVTPRENDSSRRLDDNCVKVEPQDVLVETMAKEEDSEDDQARRALLASLGDDTNEGGFTIDAIPLNGGNYSPPRDETDAYKRDVVTRPDSATLADYERVPVSQFGAALLRGMGWKEGTAASRTRTGLVEPWLPTARPTLLGIGAKERPQEEIPSSGRGGFVSKRPEKRYVPVVKIQKEGAELPPPSRSRSRSPAGSRTVSRMSSSKSASPYPRDNDTNRLPRQRDRDRIHDDHSYSGSGRDSDREKKDIDRDPDRARRKERGYQERNQEHGRERERDDWRRKEDYRRDERERHSRDRSDRY